MESRGQRVCVTILGTTYTVVSDRDEQYVRSLAAFLNERLEGLADVHRGKPIHEVVTLAALTIADELFRVRESRRDVLREIGSRSERLIAALASESGDGPDGPDRG